VRRGARAIGGDSRCFPGKLQKARNALVRTPSATFKAGHASSIHKSKAYDATARHLPLSVHMPMAAEATSIPTISSGNLGRRRQPISGTQTARALCEVRASGALSVPAGGQGPWALPHRAGRHEVPVSGYPVPRPQGHRSDTMGDEVEASPERLRHHLRRPDADEGQLSAPGKPGRPARGSP